MANTIKSLSRTTLTDTTSTTLYTVPAETTAVVTNIVIANTSSSPADVTLLLDDVSILPGVKVDQNSTTVIDLKQALSASKTIKGGASVNSALTIHITGVEIS